MLANIIMLIKHKRIFIISEWTFRYRKYRKCNPKIDSFKKKGDYYLLFLWSIAKISSTLWILFGLLTDNWPVFLFICAFNVISNIVKNSSKTNNRDKLSINLTQLLLTLTTVIVVEINYFITNLL